MIGAFANQIVQGLMLGGLYAMFALGLSLSVGVMRFVNIAHGDLIVLVSFLLLTLTTKLGLPIVPATLIAVPIAFAGGYALQRLLLQRVLGQNVLAIVLVTFGLSVIIQNGLLGAYGADTRLIWGGGIETATIPLGGGINIGVLSLVIFLSAIVLVFALDVTLYRTRLGARIRAVSDSVGNANLVGLKSAHVYALAMGIQGNRVNGFGIPWGRDL